MLENYVMLVSEYKYRKALAKLRCSAHRLNVEVSGYKGEDDDSLCNYCLSLGIYMYWKMSITLLCNVQNTLS